MNMDDESFERLLRDHLRKFQKADAKHVTHARNVRKSLKLWNEAKEKYDGSLLNWWKQQDLQKIIALQSYLFYLATVVEKMDLKLFGDIYDTLTPILSRSSNMRVVITSDSLDEPNIDGGFLKENFSIFQFDFSPSDHALQVTSRDDAIEKPYTLDFILDFLSFLVNKAGEGFLGFRPIPSSKWVSSETAVLHTSMGPEVKVAFPNYDFQYIEKALKQLDVQDEAQDTFLVRILHVRHRALLESNLESRLIVLWAFIEDLWTEDETDDKLLTHEEYEVLKNAVRTTTIAPEKLTEVLHVISGLKKKSNTKHAKITEQINKLEVGKEWDIECTRKVHQMRSRFAHGNMMKPNQEPEVRRYITFLMEIINELIAQEFLKNGVRFS